MNDVYFNHVFCRGFDFLLSTGFELCVFIKVQKD